MKVVIQDLKNPDKKEVTLQISKTMDGKVLIKDHPLIYILIAPAEKKVISIPKSSADEDTFGAQKDLMGLLFDKGLASLGSEQGGTVFGSMECRYNQNERINPIKALLLAIAEYIDSETEMYDNIRDYEDKIEDWYLEPGEEDSTELGEIPHEPKKGSVPDQPYGKYGGYFGYFY